MVLPRLQSENYSQGWSVRNQVTGLTTLISEIEDEIGETITLISKIQKL